MQKDVALNKEYDWDIYNKTQYVYGKDKAKQQAIMMLQIQQGSWLYNTNIGLLMKEYVLGQRHPQYQLFFSSLIDKLAQIDFIQSAQVIDYRVEENTLFITIGLLFENNEKDTIEYNLEIQ